MQTATPQAPETPAPTEVNNPSTIPPEPTGAAGSPTDQAALDANRTVRDDLARMEAERKRLEDEFAAIEATPVTIEERVEHAIAEIQRCVDDANEHGWRELDNKDG